MKKILIIGLDGLQMNQINDLQSPNLNKFKNNGFSFENHHSTFPTVTRSNAASIVTGVNPGTHGIVGNTMVFKEYDSEIILPVLYSEMLDVYNRTGEILLVPSLSEILSDNGLSFMVLNSGTSGNAIIQNTEIIKNKQTTFHRDINLDKNEYSNLPDNIHEWPEQSIPDYDSTNHIINILNGLDESNLSDVSIIWFDEPDKSQHNFGLNEKESNKALKHVDNLFGKIIDFVDQNSLDPTIMLISDHGYSRISDVIDIQKELHSDFPGYLFAENGGSFLVYTKRGQIFDPILINEIISKPWAGPIIAGNNKISFNGIHNYDLFANPGKRNPDLFVSMNWEKLDNLKNIKGQVYSTSLKKGLGNHGSISPQEIHNSLVIGGKRIKVDQSTYLPSSNVDILPTVLTLLGIDIPKHLEGRALLECLENNLNTINDEFDKLNIPLTTRLHNGEYIQNIHLSIYQNCKYLDFATVEK
tara:strand:- start:6830 stop:8242 length:1413 start_codon:yes stop_codon:yes gene_type:complete